MMESVDNVSDQLAKSSINGQEQEVSKVQVTEKSDENGSGCGSEKNDEEESVEDPGAENEDNVGEIEKESKAEASEVPERRTEVRQMGLPVSKKDIATVTSPVEIKQIKIGDPKLRAKLGFEVVTARVIESAGKKHVAYTVIMKRSGHDPRPAKIERRYNDFCFIYECILKSFHPSILGEYLYLKTKLAFWLLIVVGDKSRPRPAECMSITGIQMIFALPFRRFLFSQFFLSFKSKGNSNRRLKNREIEMIGSNVRNYDTSYFFPHFSKKCFTTLFLCQIAP